MFYRKPNAIRCIEATFQSNCAQLWLRVGGEGGGSLRHFVQIHILYIEISSALITNDLVDRQVLTRYQDFQTKDHIDYRDKRDKWRLAARHDFRNFTVMEN
jgi:hypothetical protein